MFGRASLAPYCASIAVAGLLAACALDVNGTGPSVGSVTGSTVEPVLDASTGIVHDAGGANPPDSKADASPGTGSGGKDATAPTAMPDSGTVTTIDASISAPDTGDNSSPDTGTTAPVDAGCTPGDNGCITVPTGWTVVAFSEVRTSACPTGFRQSPTDVVEGPNAAGACSCGDCNVTDIPTCSTGAIEVMSSTAFSQGPPCSMTSSVLENDMPGTCQLISPVNSGAPPSEVEYIPPPAAGGTCSAPGQKQTNNVVYRAQGRLCGADTAETAACSGGSCAPSVDSPYSICLMATGNVACPSGVLDVQHLVGTTADFSCGDCGCNVTADCAGTIQFFTDMRCQMAGDIANVNGTCRADSSNGGLVAYEYNPDPAANAACTAAGGSTASSPTLEMEMTLCCPQ